MNLIAAAIAVWLVGAPAPAAVGQPETCLGAGPSIAPQKAHAVIDACDALLSAGDPAQAPGAHFIRGQAYEALGEHYVARNDFDSVVQAEPGNASALVNRGAAAVELGDTNGGEADFRRAIALDSKLAAAYNDLATTLKMQRKPAEALKYYSEAYNLYNEQNGDPAIIYATLLGMGEAYLGLAQADQAIKKYDEAVGIAPEQPRAYNDRGVAHYRLKAFNDAIEDYGTAIRLGDTERAPLNRGIAFREVGKIDASLADLSRFLDAHPRNVAALENRCLSESAKGDDRLAEALTDCAKAVSISPESAEAILDRAIIYCRLRRFSEAIEAADGLLKTNSPRFARALFMRGVAKRGKGELHDGDADIATALALDSTVAEQAKTFGLAP